MAKIQLMNWDKARADAAPIRFEVFVAEQRVPAQIELDDMDAQCVHAVAYENGAPIATGRLLPDGHIGRMAVLKAWRGRGVGSAILAALMDAARRRGDASIELSAQVHAVPFYVAHGFQPVGPVYEEAGIPHQTMTKPLG